LQQLRQGDSAKEQAVITPAQHDAIEAARREIVQTRSKLRAVQLELNRDIERLETELLIFNVVMVPVLVTLGAIALSLLRRRRRMVARL
jgi:ABC-type uncharacterized transport system involved in gliding motility auxiliary subunit